MNATRGKNGTATRATHVITGLKKRFPNGSQKLTFGGGAITVTVDEAVQQLQTLLDNRDAATAAQAAARAKVATERAQLPALLAFLVALEAFLRLMFGADAQAMADFGLAPHKTPAPLTAEQKAVAAARRKATREARGTASAKAKKGVHGHVTAKLVVTPVVADDAHAPAAAAPDAAAPTQPKS